MKEINYYIVKVSNQWILVSNETFVTAINFLRINGSNYKLISQQPILSSLSEEQQKEIGFIDVDTIADNYYCNKCDFHGVKDTKDGQRILERNRGLFKEIYCIAQSLNDKKFSEKDMRLAFQAGNKRGWSGYPDTDNWTQPNEDTYINQLSKLKLIEVEIEMQTHILYDGSEDDICHPIIDRNRDVVLSACKICNKGEIELEQPCIVPKITKEGIKILKLK
jgi:hypothetical protein